MLWFCAQHELTLIPLENGTIPSKCKMMVDFICVKARTPLCVSMGAKIVIKLLINVEEESHGFRIVEIQRNLYITGTTTFSA